MRQFKRLLFIGGLIYISLFCISCSTIDRELITTKEECIQQLDLKYTEIQEKNVEYSLVLIENVIEEAKNQMDSEKDKEKIVSITETVLEELDNLLLDDEGIDIITNAWINELSRQMNFINELFGHPLVTYTKDDFEKISYYLGNYGGKYISIIKGDDFRCFTCEVGSRHLYSIWCKNIKKWLRFEYLPEPICVIYEGIYYELDEAYELAIITDEEVLDIHSKFSIIYKSIYGKNFNNGSDFIITDEFLK